MLQDILQWWNLIFLLPFAGAAIFMLIQGITGLHPGEAEAGDADHSDHAGPAAGHALDPGVDADHGIHDAHDVHYEAGHEAGAEPSGFTKALLFLGVGRVPLSTLVSTLAVLWGVTGWITNQTLEPALQSPPLFFPISCAVALAVATLGTRWTARALARFMPTLETTVTRKSDLVDSLGRVRFQVTERQGSVMVTGPRGHLQEVSCRVKPGRAPLPAGGSVILFEYDEAQDLFYAAPADLEGTGGQRHAVSTPTQVHNPKERVR